MTHDATDDGPVAVPRVGADPEVDRAEIRRRVEEVVPLAQAGASEAERSGRLAPEVVEGLKSRGLFRLGLPRGLGGWETDPRTFVETIERLSYADGATGWTTFIANSTMFFAWLEPDVAMNLVGDRPDEAATSVFTPSGRGIPEDGAYRLSGRWSMNSACEVAATYCNGFLVMDGAQPRMIGDRPDWRWAIYPARHGQVVATWNDVLGLRATGSHDVVVDDLLVRHELTIAPFFEPAAWPGALYRLPFASLAMAMMIGFPLGVARRGLDEFVQVATIPRGSRKVSLRDDDDVQTQFGLAEAGLRSARGFAFDALDTLWASNLDGPPSLDQRVDFALALQESMRSATSALDTVFALVGARSLRDDDQLQRCWRDVHTAAHHIVFSREGLRRSARHFLGVEQDDLLL